MVKLPKARPQTKSARRSSVLLSTQNFCPRQWLTSDHPSFAISPLGRVLQLTNYVSLPCFAQFDLCSRVALFPGFGGRFWNWNLYCKFALLLWLDLLPVFLCTRVCLAFGWRALATLALTSSFASCSHYVHDVQKLIGTFAGDFLHYRVRVLIGPLWFWYKILVLTHIWTACSGAPVRACSGATLSQRPTWSDCRIGLAFCNHLISAESPSQVPQLTWMPLPKWVREPDQESPNLSHGNGRVLTSLLESSVFPLRWLRLHCTLLRHFAPGESVRRHRHCTGRGREAARPTDRTRPAAPPQQPAARWE